MSALCNAAVTAPCSPSDAMNISVNAIALQEPLLLVHVSHTRSHFMVCTRHWSRYGILEVLKTELAQYSWTSFGRGPREENLGKIKVNLSIQKGTSSNYPVWKTYLLSRIKSIIITTALIRKTTYIKRCVVSNNYLNTNLASLTPQGASSRIKNSFQRNLHV